MGFMETLSSMACEDQATEWLWFDNKDRPIRPIGGVSPEIKLKVPA
jgi:hypothetical protein